MGRRADVRGASARPRAQRGTLVRVTIPRITGGGESIPSRATKVARCERQELALHGSPRRSFNFMPRTILSVVVCAVCLSAALPAQRRLPTPASIFGFEPGADNKLATYDQVVDYFKKVDAA